MYLSKFDNKLNVNIFFTTLLLKNSMDENNINLNCPQPWID